MTNLHSGSDLGKYPMPSVFSNKDIASQPYVSMP